MFRVFRGNCLNVLRDRYETSTFSFGKIIPICDFPTDSKGKTASRKPNKKQKLFKII